jgi:hypothetical protein
VIPDGKLYLPWTLGSDMPYRIAIGYAAFALLMVGLHFTRRDANSGGGT